MNPDRLLAQFDRLVEAPDAIPRLRRFILDLAVRGKLLKTDSRAWKEQSIEMCLEKLNDGQFIHQGWSPRCETHPSSSEVVWGVLKTTAIQDGYFLCDQNKELPGKISPKSKLEVQAGDILITCAGPRARCGVACYVSSVRKKLMISGKMYRFRANEKFILPRYLTLFLRSEGAQSKIDALKTGSNESGLNLTQDRFKSLKVRFGSISEQQEIIAKVDEMIALCDQLEAAQAEREQGRKRLLSASLQRLNKPAEESENFRQHARFVLDNLPHLTVRSEQIKSLRQTILNLAVRGLLVPQESSDEPVQCLLNSLKKIQADAIKSGNISAKQVLRKESCQKLYDIFSSWAWIPLRKTIVFGPQNGVSPKETIDQNSPKSLKLTATSSGVFDSSYYKRVDISFAQSESYWLRDGDVIFQRGNTRDLVGIAAIYHGPDREFLFPDLMIRVRFATLLNLRYLHLALISPPLRAYFGSSASGASQSMPKISQKILLDTPIPLPPLAEQHRIVAKVDELMAICDQLEAHLTTTRTDTRCLLEAVLRDALAPALADAA